MAFNVSYIYIAKDKFTSVSRKINNSVKKSKKNFKDLGNQYQRTGRKFQRTTNQIKRNSSSIASSLKGMFAAGLIVLGFRKLITVGAEFQDSLLDLSAITGATGKDLDFLKQKTFELAKESAVSQATIVNAFKLVGSAKAELLKNIPALVETTKQVLLLKNASGIDLAEAALIVARSLNIFGKSAQFANEFVNILAAGAQAGASEIADVGQAVLIAGPQARNAGLDFASLNAAIQATARGGFVGAQAGTALRTIINRLLTIQTIIPNLDLEIQTKGLPQALERLKIGFSRISNLGERNLLMKSVFGEEAIAVGFALMDNIDLMRDLEKKIRGTTVATEQANTKLASFNSKMRRLSATIGQKLIQAFLKLEPALLTVTNEFGKFIEAITPEQIDLFVAAVGGAMKSAVALVRLAVESIKLMFKDFDIVAFTGKVEGAFLSIEKLAGMAESVVSASQSAAAFVGTPGRVGGHFFDLFTEPVRNMFGSAPSAPVTNTNNARADVNVNLNAPPGVIQSTSTSVSGNRQAMNLGVNMAPI